MNKAKWDAMVNAIRAAKDCSGNCEPCKSLLRQALSLPDDAPSEAIPCVQLDEMQRQTELLRSIAENTRRAAEAVDRADKQLDCISITLENIEEAVVVEKPSPSPEQTKPDHPMQCTHGVRLTEPCDRCRGIVPKPAHSTDSDDAMHAAVANAEAMPAAVEPDTKGKKRCQDTHDGHCCYLTEGHVGEHRDRFIGWKNLSAVEPEMEGEPDVSKWPRCLKCARTEALSCIKNWGIFESNLSIAAAQINRLRDENANLSAYDEGQQQTIADLRKQLAEAKAKAVTPEYQAWVDKMRLLLEELAREYDGTFLGNNTKRVLDLKPGGAA